VSFDFDQLTVAQLAQGKRLQALARRVFDLNAIHGAFFPSETKMRTHARRCERLNGVCPDSLFLESAPTGKICQKNASPVREPAHFLP
jgi:hypothetical protein